MSKDPQGHYHQRLYALDLATGAERRSSPVTIRASYPGTGDGSDDGHVLFNPAQYKERPGLLLLRGVVYTFWSSNCDHRPYTGWVIGYAAHGLRSKRVLDLTPNGHDGAIWASGAGPAAGPGGHIYFLDGNGSFGRRFDSRGFPIDHDFGNAFIRLSVSGGRIRVSDYFNMDHTRAESRADEDLGSGGALVLPPLRGQLKRIRKLAIGAGKDGHIYVVNRNDMGGFHPERNDIWQELPHALKGPEFGMPAYFNHEIYFGAVGQPIRAFRIQGT
ncbi:Pyrrolo-quinoline quinone, partial [mine drainage metagenome]